MANMGLSRLVVAGPRGYDWMEARKMAMWAVDILEQRQEVPTLADAVADCGLVLGATARMGLYRQHAKTPREWAPEIVAAAASTNVALVFGAEDNGLSNDELELCSRLIRIPSSEHYPSLNLSHAVMVCAYELFMTFGVFNLPLEKSPEATGQLKERLFTLWEQALLDIGFMKEEKARHMMLGIRRIFGRGRLTEDDVRILMGIARQTQWCASQMRSECPPEPDGISRQNPAPPAQPE